MRIEELSIKFVRCVARIFRGEGGGGRGCVLAVKIQTCRGVRGHLPRVNFRIFGLPWTTFRAFSW